MQGPGELGKEQYPGSFSEARRPSVSAQVRMREVPAPPASVTTWQASCYLPAHSCSLLCQLPANCRQRAHIVQACDGEGQKGGFCRPSMEFGGVRVAQKPCCSLETKGPAFLSPASLLSFWQQDQSSGCSFQPALTACCQGPVRCSWT